MRRRDVFKLVGWMLLGSGGSACLNGKATEPGGSLRRTVVIGAGLAGLVAARELRRNGHEVGVLEARDRPCTFDRFHRLRLPVRGNSSCPPFSLTSQIMAQGSGCYEAPKLP